MTAGHYVEPERVAVRLPLIPYWHLVLPECPRACAGDRSSARAPHQEIPRRFDMHQFMSTYKIQKCACRHFLFSAQVYVEIFFTCRHVFFSCQHIYLELSIVNILDEPFDMHFIHSTCSLYL